MWQAGVIGQEQPEEWPAPECMWAVCYGEDPLVFFYLQEDADKYASKSEKLIVREYSYDPDVEIY